MDFLNLKFGSHAQAPRRLPVGSFTVDPSCRILSSTVPQSVPTAQLVELGRQVIATFNEARNARVVLSELVLHFAALKVTAREMRGGAIIFIAAKV